MANFSVDFLVGKSVSETESDDGRTSGELEEERPRSSAFVSTQSEKNRPSQIHTWHDVLQPHVQMASTNPFLLGPVLDGRDRSLAESNALALQQQRQLQSSLWTQQWYELVHQASQGRFLPGGETQVGLFLQPFRKPKRIRTAFSPTQLLQLEHAFDSNHYVIGAERKQLAQRLQLTETQVKVWFQNRRTKHKRIKTEEDGKKHPKVPSPVQKQSQSSAEDSRPNSALDS